MRKPKDLLLENANTVHTLEDVVRMAQKDAIEYTLKLSAKKYAFDYSLLVGDIKSERYEKNILSLKDELFKELE